MSDLKLSKIGVITAPIIRNGHCIDWYRVRRSGRPCSRRRHKLYSTVTTAEVVGIAMETDAGAWTLTDDPRAGYTIAFPGGEMLAMQKSDCDAIDRSWWYFKKELFIPSSLLDIAMASGTSGPWGQYLSDLINNHGATATLKGGIHTGALDENQVQYTTAYDASIVAQGGKTSFLKQMNIDTRNKVTSQSNIKTQTGMTFAATADGGNVVGSENLMLDGAGDLTYAGERMLCPFGSGADALIPAFCNIVQSGSKYDLTIGSVTTTADEPVRWYFRKRPRGYELCNQH